MKYIKKFNSVSDMNTALASSTISVLGMAYNNGTPVINNKVVEPVPPTPSHDYVEIGGVKWATMNVGASTIYDAGLYFQWGDEIGNPASVIGTEDCSRHYTYEDYKFYDENNPDQYLGFTKYNEYDELNELEGWDDAVYAAWGDNWRMPTTLEIYALIDATNQSWVENYNGSGVNGMLCTDKTDNSKVLFFPASGYCTNDSLIEPEVGYIWSKSLSLVPGDYNCGYHMVINDSSDIDVTYSIREFGYPCRGILDE